MSALYLFARTDSRSFEINIPVRPDPRRSVSNLSRDVAEVNSVSEHPDIVRNRPTTPRPLGVSDPVGAGSFSVVFPAEVELHPVGDRQTGPAEVLERIKTLRSWSPPDRSGIVVTTRLEGFGLDLVLGRWRWVEGRWGSGVGSGTWCTDTPYPQTPSLPDPPPSDPFLPPRKRGPSRPSISPDVVTPH